MAVQVWDTAIPNPTNQFDNEWLDVSARTGELFGEKNVRRRMMKAVAKSNLTFILTNTEKVAFETFYISTCSKGAAWFTAGWLAYLGFATHQARIVEREMEIIAVGLWQVSVSLAIRDVGAN